MCGRFVLSVVYRELAEHFDLSGEIEFSPSWNIAPSTRICSITADKEGNRHLVRMKWGLILRSPLKTPLHFNKLGRTVRTKTAHAWQV
jgi:putative SOS response-associated peptidase YedK